MLRRAGGRDEFSLSFANLSPSTPLDFLDLHYAINAGPATNIRLFTDPTQPSTNDVRALDGLTMTTGDRIAYTFTYGVKEPGEAMGKVRACNTELFTETVSDK